MRGFGDKLTDKLMDIGDSRVPFTTEIMSNIMSRTIAEDSKLKRTLLSVYNVPNILKIPLGS